MRKQNTFIIIIFIFCFVNANAQNKTIFKGLSVKPTIHYGFIMSHHPEMTYFTDRHISPFEISFFKKTNGIKSWHKHYKYPEIGISLFTTSFASSKILGNTYASYPFVNFPLYSKQEYGFNFKIGTGLGYFTKKFNRFDNPKNLAISTSINALISLRGEIYFKTTSQSDFSLGLGITHFSNGAVKTPNLGLNIVTASASVSLYPFNRTKIADTINSFEKYKKFLFSYWLAGAVKETYPVYGNKFKAGTLSIDAMLTLSNTSRLGLAADLFYDEADKKYLIDHEINFKKNIEVGRAGISAVHELRFSKISFLQYMGVYLYHKNKSTGSLYQRLAIRYDIYKGLFAGVSLKTHWGKADFTEWAIGYRY